MKDNDFWEKWPAINAETERLMGQFAADNIRTPARLRDKKIKVTLPWSRFFECDPSFY